MRRHRELSGVFDGELELALAGPDSQLAIFDFDGDFAVLQLSQDRHHSLGQQHFARRVGLNLWQLITDTDFLIVPISVATPSMTESLTFLRISLAVRVGTTPLTVARAVARS